jgi:hypothetical protein
MVNPKKTVHHEQHTTSIETRNAEKEPKVFLSAPQRDEK